VYVNTSQEERVRIIEEKKTKARELELREKELADEEASGRKGKSVKKKLDLDKVEPAVDPLQAVDSAVAAEAEKKESDAK
jgi:hypothetical protein